MHNKYDNLRWRPTMRLKVALLLTLTFVVLSLTSFASRSGPTLPDPFLASISEPMCVDGEQRECTHQGRKGIQTCTGGHWGPCSTDEPDPSSINNGRVRPKFYILTVLYAPPGTASGVSPSSVTYGSGSSTGTKAVISSTFQAGIGVTATVEANLTTVSLSAQASFGFSQTTNDSETINIEKTTTSKLSNVGPPVDGIDHDRDLIYLWLNPAIDIALTPTSAAWTFPDRVADIQYVYVGWLKDPSRMPQYVAMRLAQYKITSDDYKVMLEADPFADGSTAIDPNRYRMINTTFPYEPPFSPTSPVPTQEFACSIKTGTENASSVEKEYKVGASVEVGSKFADVWKATVKVEGHLAWTSKDTTTKVGGTSETATAVVGGPSFEYTGPTDIGVYYDVLYKTFMFAPVEIPLDGCRGVVQDQARQPQPFKEVVLISRGVKYRTFTNARGEYRIYGHLSGPIRLRSGKTVRRLRRVPTTREVPITLH